jgi:diguanylate cyclase (GGDEF)-like protein/PAS domain S-box-containing protein
MIVTCKDGHIKDVLLHYRKIEDMGLVVFYDITERVKLEQELQRYIRVIDDNVITSQTDKDGYITYASKAFCKISGYSKEELFGKTHEVVRHPDTPGSVYEELWDTLEKNMIWRGELKNRDKSGNDYWVDTVIYPLFDVFDSKIGYMSVRNDITDKKKIEQISITDRLTGIYNRLKLDEALGVEYERFSRYESKFSVILFDIDKFKSVNDTYGHIEGDNVLKKVAEVTGKNIRATDCFGRWGGEEFLIICSETVKDDASILAEKIRKLIENTDFGIDRTITCSFGVAEISINDNAEQLVSRADKLLYKAKENGRNRVEM